SGGLYYDDFTVTAGGETVAWVSSSYIREFSVELFKGQTLTFSFYRSPYSYLSGGTALISYILIFA
ncbi:MAG: hypothetical protein K2H30_05580, partial [Clostridia bacterium]|nr:hypothetical protein [Clostridia bacterium]